MKNVTYVFGHKNPDTDSVVSAYCFAYLKNCVSRKNGQSETYVAARAGKLSPQTEYVFNKFDLVPPVFISDLTPRVEYYMGTDFSVIDENQSLQVASTMMQKNDLHFLSVVDENKHYKAMLHYSAFAKNLINSLNPEHHIKVFTNNFLLHQSLGALLACDASFIDKKSPFRESTIIIAASEFDSFKKTIDSRPDQNLVVIVGDRKDIIEYAILKKVYCVIVSGGRSVDGTNIQLARENGVCLLLSPFDTASTAMLASYSAPVDRIADSQVKPVKKSDPIHKIKKVLHTTPGNVLPVVDDDGMVVGIITENMLLNEPKISVSLVDHNELSQAVDGVENYRINEIIDHHRIGSIDTKYPVTFINSVVGSTATIITRLFEEASVPFTKEIAGLLLAGILSDTLILKSATTTSFDTYMAEKLAAVAGVHIQEFGEEIIHAGSRIGNRSAQELVVQDLKEYEEGSVKFTVSQIEVDDTDGVLERKAEFMSELETQKKNRGVTFTALLVTDITKLDSLLFMVGEGKNCPVLNFPMIEENVYLLKGIVSRKKQLIPLISELIARG